MAVFRSKFAAALALLAALGVAACREDSSSEIYGDEKMPFGQPIPKSVPAEIAAAVTKTSAPPRVYPSAHEVRDDRFLQMTFDLATQDGRALRVTAAAYCEKYDELPESDYAGRCGQYIKLMLDFHARNYACFEGAVPAASPAVRNHPGLQERNHDCLPHYPENYASFTPSMMRTALELTKYDQNLYTVIAIQPLGPR